MGRDWLELFRRGGQRSLPATVETFREKCALSEFGPHTETSAMELQRPRLRCLKRFGDGAEKAN